MKVAPLFRSLLLSSVSMVFVDIGYADDTGGQYVVGADNTDSTVQDAVNGPVSLVKDGSGTVTVTGTNTYSGSTSVNNGTLIFNVGQQYVLTSSVTVSSYTDSYPKMVVDNSLFASDGNVAIGIAQGSSGELSIQGANSNFQNQALFVVGNGDSSYGTGSSTKTSILRIADGAQASAYGVVVGNYGNTSGEVDVVGQGSTLTARSYNLYINGDGQGTVNVSDGGQISNNGQVIFGSGVRTGFATLNVGPNGTLVAGDVSPSKPGIITNLSPSQYKMLVNNGTIQNYQGFSLHSAVNMTLNGTLYANTLDQQSEFSGVLSGKGGVDKQGTGSLTLSGNNSFQGGTTVEGGNLLITGKNQYTGDTVVQHGSIQIGNGGNTGSIDNSPNIILKNSDASVVFNRSDSLTATQKITGAGGLTQQGPGSLRLTGNNDYKGETWVKGGTLIVNGDQSAATGDTQVTNSGILAGTGTLGGDGIIQAGGRVAPGDGEYIGALNIKKNLSFDPNSHQTWLVGRDSENSAASSSFINVGGNLSLAGSVDVIATPQGRNMKPDGSLQDGIYRTYSYDGTLSIDPSFHLATEKGVNINTIDVQTAVSNQVNLVSNPQHLTFWSATHIGDDGAGVDHHIYGGEGFWAGANAPKNRGGYLPSGAFDKAGDNWTDLNAQTHGPWGSGQFAVFERKAGTVTVQSTQSDPVLVDGMQFANTDGGVYTLNGDPIYASSKMLTIRVGDGSSVSGSIKALINSTLDDSMVSGGAGLTKLDPGTLILGANNNYQGQTFISGGTLQLGNGGETGSVGAGEIVNKGTLAVNRSNGITLGQTISGSGDVWQNGSGTTTLMGNNSYTGATHVTNGTLALAGSSSISQSAGVRVDGDSAKFDLSSLNNHGTSIQTLSGQGQVILGGNDLTITNGNSTVNTVFRDDGETINVTSNTYSGEGNDNTVYIDSNGKVIPKSQYNADNGDRVVDLNKDGSVVVGNRFNGSISGSGGVNITGGQEIFSGQNTFSGRMSVSSGAGLILTGSLQGGAVDPNQGGLYNQGTVTVDGGTISGKSINDNANATLTGVNHSTFGDIENNSGKLVLRQSLANSIKNNGYALIDGSTINGVLAVGSNGSFEVSSNNATIGSLTGAGAGKIDGNLTVENAQGTYSGSMDGAGSFTVNNGKQILTGDSNYTGLTTIGKNAIVQYGDGGTTGRIKGIFPNTNPQIRDDGQLIIDHSNLVQGTSGIFGSGSLHQVGTGTTVLSGNNSYTGGTTVTNGTLQVDGDQSPASGDTIVQSGANLAGSGILGGNVYLQKGATLSPGDAPETIGAFTIQGNLTEENGSQQKWDIGQIGTAGGAYNDYVNAKGDLTLGGQLVVNANLNGPSVHNGVLEPGVYRLYSYGGKLSDNGLTINKGNLSIPDGYTGDYLTLQKLSVPNQVNIVADAKNLNFWDGGNPAHHGDNPSVGNGVVDGGDGEWIAHTGNNWTSVSGFSNTGWLLGGRAIFTNTPGTVTVKDHNSLGQSDPVTTIGMQFIGGDAQNHYKITGDDLFVTNKNTTIRVGDGTLASKNMVAEIGSVLNDSQVAGGGALTKSDLGTLILTADNAYKGGTTIDAGTLQLGNGGSSGWAGSGDITNNGVLEVNRSNDVNFTQKISGSGSFVQMGGNDSHTTLSAQEGYTGSTTILNGTLALAGEGSIAQSSGVMSSAPGHFDIAGISASGTPVTTLGGQGYVNLGDKNLTLTNANRTIRVQLLESQDVKRSVDISDDRYTGSNGNHLIYTDADGKVIASNAYDPNKGDLVFDFSKDGQLITDNQYGGVISGSGGLTIANGTEILSGANTYKGMTRVTQNATLLLPGSLKGDVTNAGVVDVNGGLIAGTTTNNGSNAVLTAENNASLGNIINNDGRATLVNASAQDVTNSSEGTFSATGGQLESLTNAGTTSLINGNNVKQNVTNTGKLTLDGDTIGGTLYSNGGSFTVTNNTASVGSLAGSAPGTLNGHLTLTNAHDTYSGVLSGNNQQVDIQKGTQVFSGQNSYTGDTFIGNDATLQLGDGGETGSVASGTIRDEGNLVINRSNDYLLSQALLGGGNVKQIGAGRTIITSPNAYTGFTSIEHGRLALQEGGSVLRSSGVHVNNDGVFDISEIKAQSASSGGVHSGLTIPGGTPDVQTGNDGKTAIVQALDGNGNVFLGDKNLQISNANTAFGNKYSGIVSGKGEVTLTGGQEIFEGTNTSSGITSVAIPATLILKGSLQHDAKNAGKLDVDGGSIAGQTVNNGSSALLTAENNASFSDIVNTQGRVALTNATAGNVTNAAGQTFGASGGKLASVTNSGTATLGKQNVVTGDVTNTANLTLDGNTVNGTLHSNSGLFDVTNNNAQIGSLVGTANGTLTGELKIANAHDTYDGVMSGGGSVNVSGGTQIFSADQRYAGDTTIGKNATLQLGLGGTTGGVARTAINDDGTLKINRSNRYDISQVVSGVGDLVQAGTGRTVVNTSQAYRGATTVENGVLALNDNGSIESSSGVHVLNNSVFDISGGQTAQPFSLFRLSLFAVDDAAQTSNTGQTKTIQALDGSGNISLGNNTLKISNANEKFGNLYTGVISGNGGVNITGGKEIFTGQQTYAGTTAVSPNAELTLLKGSLQGDVYNKGTVTVDGGQVAGQSTNDDANAVLTGLNKAQFGDINNQAGRVLLHQSNANTLTNQGYVLLDGATITGAVDTGKGTFDVSAQNATVGSLTGAGKGTLSGLLTIQQGQGTYGGALQGIGGLTVNTGKQIMTGDSTYSGTTTIGSHAVVQYGDGGTSGRATGSPIVNDGQLMINHSNRVDMASAISGSGRFDQVGSGVTALSGNNSYTGETTVEHGTLQVDGDQSKATGATTVQSGATLAGRGTLGGNATVQSGATFAPGDVSGAVGGLTVKGNLVTEAGSQQQWTIGQAGIAGGSYNDYVNVQGDLTLGGTLKVNVNSGPSVHDNALDAGVYRLYDYGGNLYGPDGKAFAKNDLALGKGNLAIPENYQGDYLTLQTEMAHQINLVVDAKNLNFWDGGNPANHGTDVALGNGHVDGGDGEWVARTGNNWTTFNGAGNVGWLAASRAIFSAQTGTVTVKDSAADGSFNPVKITGMQFISGDAQNHYKITGDDLYAASNNTVINVGNGRTSEDSAKIVAELNSAINDSQVQGGTALTKTGLGTLIVTADNHYQGSTTIDAGTLQLGNGGTTGTTGSADILDNGALAVNRSNDLTLAQKISGTGSLAQRGSGSTTLTNENSYSGATDLINGTLNLRGKGSIAQSAGVQSAGNARFDISGIDAAGTSVQTLGGQGQVHLGDKTLTLSDAKRTVGQDGQILTDNHYSGVIDGQGGLTLAKGMEILSGDNRYTGETGIDKGTILQVGAGGTTGSAGSGAIRDDGRFIVNRSNDYALPQNLYGSGDFVQAGTGRTFIQAPSNYTGATTVEHGTLVLSQNGGVQHSSGVHVASDGSFDISGLGTGTTAVQALDGTGSVALGSKTLQLSNANAPFGNVYSGVMSGAGGSLSITGGQEVLTGANTYTGTTSIASGAGLQLTGSLQSAVSNAGTFDVNGGRVAGQTVNDGSHALMTAE
ncbi:autotransporter-associated beta strand repeat-containing protein, partial [Saccharibacter sp. EH611]|uniref:autotransporter-associated beta strand repeat-containing protein n=3 Tax=unclassified Saccharibacter TaxID=2648722 RepID=UPI001F34C2A1